MGQQRATLHRGDEDRSFPCFSNCLFSSRRPGSQSGDAKRRIIASLANGMATRYRHHARTASCHLHRRRLGRRHLFRRGSSPARSRHPACHFRQRFLHHGNLSASESHRALRPADEGHRWKYLCAWLRRRHGIRKTRRSHHPLDHGRIHAELPQRQPTILHAHSLRYELRRVIFPPCHPRQRRRHTHCISTPEHGRRRPICPHLVSERQRLRTRYCHAFLLFCRQLHALVFFSLRAP